MLRPRPPDASVNQRRKAVHQSNLVAATDTLWLQTDVLDQLPVGPSPGRPGDCSCPALRRRSGGIASCFRRKWAAHRRCRPFLTAA